MSLYRQAGGRSTRVLVAALLAGVLLGGLVGFLVGRGSVEEPSAAEVIGDARAELQPVSAGLELVPIEYGGAVQGGSVTEETEYSAAVDAAMRAEAALAAAEDMREIDPAGYAAATEAVSRLVEAVEAVEPPARVDALAAEARARVTHLTGPETGGAQP